MDINSDSQKVLIVDDHPTIIKGTIEEIKKDFTSADIFTANNYTDAITIIKENAINLAIVDLRIPENNNSSNNPKSEFGLSLLQYLMKKYQDLNIVIQTSGMDPLISILSEIEEHSGGIVISPKSLSSDETRKRIQWAFEGITYTKDLKKELNITNIHIKMDWYQVMKFAFEEAMIDSEIAKKMNMSEANIRRIWEKIYDALDIERNKGLNLRILTYNKAMKMNYIKPYI